MNAFPAMRARIPMPPRSSIPLFNRRALVSAAMAFPMIALAGDPAPPVELPAVVIQSSALARTAEELVHPVDVIADDELQRLQRGTIGDVLADRPGIANASFGPGAGRPVIRGQGGPRVQVLENGIGSMDASTVSADHAVSVDPLGAEQIEVIKGPATLIYGSAASAGVVNVIDDRLPDEVTPGLRLRSDLSYGSNADEKKAAAKARYGNSSVQVGADYSRRSAGDFSIPGYADRLHEGEVADEEMVSGRLDNSSLRSERYGASTAWSGKRGMIGAAVSRYETNYGIPGGHAHEHDHEHEGEEEEEGHSHEGVRIDLEQTRFDGRGLLNDPLPGFESLELRFGINDYKHREVEASGEIGTTFKVRELDGRAQLKHRPLSGWTGVVGLHMGDRDFEAVGEEAAFAPPVVTRGLGLFVVEGREVGAHRVEVGARVDRIEHDAADPASPDRDFTPLSLSAGVNFMLSEHLHLRVNGQRAQRAPASEELYANGAHLATSSFERGDTTLKEETANTLDLSLERDQGRWTWTASTYLNYVQDYVFLREVDGDGDGVADRVDETGAVDPDGELLLVDYAQRDARFYGAELSARYRLIQTGPLRLSLRGFADTVRGELSGGDNLPRITPTRFGGSAEASYGPFGGSLAYVRAQKQDRVASLETTTPGYDLVSADVGYTLDIGGARTTLYLQGRNLLDEKVRLSTSLLKDVAPQPGRSVFAGVRIDFQPPV